MSKKQEMMDQLLDKLHADPNYERAETVYVSIYRGERCYGGPEEGGWWYDRDELQGSIPFATRKLAEDYLEAAKAEVEAQNKAEAPQRARNTANIPEGPDPYHDTEGYIPLGWSDGGTSYVIIESRMGEHDSSNRPRPHYE
jgi:hypothetical protein